MLWFTSIIYIVWYFSNILFFITFCFLKKEYKQYIKHMQKLRVLVDSALSLRMN